MDGKATSDIPTRGLWYDAYWQVAYECALRFLSRAYPAKAEAFVEALATFRIAPDFTARQLAAFFEPERIAEIRDLIEGLPKSELETYELLPYGRLVLHDHPYFADLQAQLVGPVGEAVGEPVEASYNFLSLYNNLGVCDLHMDAPSAKWTLDVCIDQSAPWPLHISGVQRWPFRLDDLPEDWRTAVLTKERFSSYVLEPGDALLFGGSAQWHYRERIPRVSANNFCHLIFFHFTPAGAGPLAEPELWSELFGVPELRELVAISYEELASRDAFDHEAAQVLAGTERPGNKHSCSDDSR